jgi:hypothetical protein
MVSPCVGLFLCRTGGSNELRSHDCCLFLGWNRPNSCISGLTGSATHNWGVHLHQQVDNVDNDTVYLASCQQLVGDLWSSVCHTWSEYPKVALQETQGLEECALSSIHPYPRIVPQEFIAVVTGLGKGKGTILQDNSTPVSCVLVWIHGTPAQPP